VQLGAGEQYSVGIPKVNLEIEMYFRRM